MNPSFIEKLADPDRPVPGGGAAAAYAGSLALALFKKIAQVEMRRCRANTEDFSWQNLLEQVSVPDKNLYRLRDEDGDSYLRLMRAKKSGSDAIEIASALRQAIDCPVQIMKQAYVALVCIRPAAKHLKKHLLADLQVVCELLGAAGSGAHCIAQANLRLLPDPALKEEYRNKLDKLHHMTCEALKQAQASILQRFDNF